MKFLFIALAYFAVGFLFPGFSPALTIILGVIVALATLIVVFTLYDDRFEEIME